MNTKKSRPWLLAVGVVPLALTLTGCFGLPGLPSIPGVPGGDSDGVNDELVENIVEGAGGGDVDFESGSLPEGFPEGDIPLVSGEIGPSMAVGSDSAWTVTVYTDEATAESAAGLLEQAGFSNDSVFAWENDEYIVVLATTEETDGNRWQVYYQVQRQQ
jgi:hypothetical protein